MSTYPDRGLQRILAGSVDPVLRVVLSDQDGDAEDAVGTLTCTITRADGTVIATDRATASATGLGAYTCALTTAEAVTLDVLTATWSISGTTRATSYHRVVGGFLFSIAELAQRAGMTEFDQASLRIERDRITDLIEHHCGAQTPRYDLVEFEGHGHQRHAVWHRPVRSVRALTIGGSPVTVSDLDVNVAAGIVSGITFTGWCVLGIEHGLSTPDHDLKDAALTAAADRVLRESSTIGPRARSVSNDLGVTTQFSYAGDGHPTGIDEVDAVIMARAKARI
jgi:hypothetical protein